MSKVEDLKESKSEKEENEKSNAEIDLTGDGGVIKRIIAQGFGDLSPEDGNDVSIAYTGRFLESGEIFEWREDKDSVVFRLGQGEVCVGLERAIVTMKKREVAEIKIQPKYGFGAEGQPPSIPGNAALVYQVRLLDWNNEVDISESQDGGIIKRILTCGEGWDKPTEDIRVKVFIEGSTDDDEVFESKEIEFITEEESIKQAGILPSLMRGILTMKLNEVSLFNIKSKYGYGKEGDNTRNIMPNENLIYKVKLLEFEQEDKEYKKLSSHEKLELATAKKDYGNNLYNNYIMERAIRKYSLSLKILNSIYITENEEDKQAIKKLKITCHLNIAACYLKLDKEKEAVQECSSALKIEPDNLKALFRRGRARMEMKDCDNAEIDFKKALEIDSENQEIKNELIRLDAKRKEQDKKDKSIFGGMFKRGHLYEDKTVAHLSFWGRFTSTIFSPGITQEQITVMNFVFIALFITTIITIILSKPSIHLFVLLGLSMFLFLVINWFIANTHPEKEKSDKDEKTE